VTVRPSEAPGQDQGRVGPVAAEKGFLEDGKLDTEMISEMISEGRKLVPKPDFNARPYSFHT